MKVLASFLLFLKITASINFPHQEIIWLIAFLVSVGCFCLMCKVTESVRFKLSTDCIFLFGNIAYLLSSRWLFLLLGCVVY